MASKFPENVCFVEVSSEISDEIPTNRKMDISSVFGQKFVRNFRRISLPSEWPSEWSVFSCSELGCHLITDLKVLAGTPSKLHWNTLELKPAKENHRER
ncbi:hypothetical protein DY000_02055701 [Brassica cretica]|uniref:Uncharacterized protein n=1 Tax=Brassica cretica TaxID=69181 RepID=A0ABQ7ALY0_BRACR|nr:hypothetical protein DY000_02055701 [Brassica cretica]